MELLDHFTCLLRNLYVTQISSVLSLSLVRLVATPWITECQAFLSITSSRSLLVAGTRDPTHDKVMRRKPDRQGRSGFQGFWKGQLTRSHPCKVTRRKPDRQGGSGFQGFQKAAPGAHLKDDICLSDACFNRLLPNFCDTGRRPTPISFQIRINLEL